MRNQLEPLFHVGRVMTTLAALDACNDVGVPFMELLLRHSVGDHGDVDVDDASMNAVAIAHDELVFSAYELGKGLRVWIVTRGDRMRTLIVLPEEYEEASQQQ